MSFEIVVLARREAYVGDCACAVAASSFVEFDSYCFRTADHRQVRDINVLHSICVCFPQRTDRNSMASAYDN